MKLQVKPAETKPQGTGAAPIPENPPPPKVGETTPVGASNLNPNPSPEDLKPVELNPKKDEEVVKYEQPKRGVRFRRKKTEYTLGEFDSLNLVQKWIEQNEVDPSTIEVLGMDEQWVCFDKVMQSKK